MTTLIRFDAQDQRQPSGELWKQMVDGLKGSSASYLNGHRYFDDFSPYNASNITVAGSETDAAADLRDTRDGVVGEIRLSAGVASDNEVGFSPNIRTELDEVRVLCIEARINETTADDAVQFFIGFSDAAVDAVFASSALAVSSNQDTYGLLRNIDGSIDFVIVKDGAAVSVVIEDIVEAPATITAGYQKLGVRLEKNNDLIRIVPAVDGAIKRAKITTVDASDFTLGAVVKPVFVTNHSDNAAAVATDYDWVAVGDDE